MGGAHRHRARFFPQQLARLASCTLSVSRCTWKHTLTVSMLTSRSAFSPQYGGTPTSQILSS